MRKVFVGATIIAAVGIGAACNLPPPYQPPKPTYCTASVPYSTVNNVTHYFYYGGSCVEAYNLLKQLPGVIITLHFGDN